MRGETKKIGKITIGNPAPVLGGAASSGTRSKRAILAYRCGSIFDGVPMGDGLMGRILQQADATSVDFIHAVCVLRNIAGRTTLQNDHLQSGAPGYFFRHHQAAPAAADDHYIRGFKALQPLSPAKDA